MTEEPIDRDTTRMTLGEHLEELRRRLAYALLGLAVAVGGAMVWGRDLMEYMEKPYAAAMKLAGREGEQLAVFNVGGGFTMWWTVSLYAGLIVAAPWVFLQLWMFIAAGLYPRERRYVTMAIPFSALLFAAGAAFAVVISFPAIQFFVNFDNWVGVKAIIGLSDYIDFMVTLMLVMGLVFQMPLLVLVLAKVGLADMAALRKYRPHVIVGIAVFAAVFAPPDVFSMIAMGLPMWLLYELGVLLAWLLVLRKPAPSA